MKEQVIQDIIEEAKWAPSGENVQPWRIRIQNQQLQIFNTPESDTSLYNFRQRSSLTSIGCFIENIRILCVSKGLDPKLFLFPSTSNKNHIATFDFAETSATNAFLGTMDSKLAAVVEKRGTNRKPYKQKSVPSTVLDDLSKSVVEDYSASLKFITEASVIEELAAIGSVNEMLVFQNESLHNYFFKHLTLSEAEEKAKPGFFVKTLEVPPPVELLFRLIKNWKLMLLFIKLGLPKIIKKANFMTYKSSPAIGLLYTSSRSDEAFVKLGQAFQYIWLRITREGLALQPMTGLLFFAQAMQDGAKTSFTDSEKHMIEEGYTSIETLLAAENKNIPIMFRVGYADPPSATSSRHPMKDIILKD